MAKRRKTKKRKGGGGRRRIGGKMSSGELTLMFTTVLGGLGVMIANDKIKKADGTKPLQGKLPGIAELVLGGLMVWKGGPMLKGLGLGVSLAGAVNAGKSFGFLSGVSLGNVPREFQNGQPISGFRNVPAVGAPFPRPKAVGKANYDKMYGGVYR